MRKAQIITMGIAMISCVSVSAQKVEGKITSLKTKEPIAGGEIIF